jgi:lysophospholipase L1-like esterase
MSVSKEAQALNATRWLWGTIGITSVLSSLLLMIGFVYAIMDISGLRTTEFMAEQGTKQPDSELAKEEGRIDIVAIGDSLTRGTGDQTGAGYVGRLKLQLADATGDEVHVLNNLGVNGYRTDQLLHDLTEKPSVAETLKLADMIVFTIGGNDLFQFALEELDVASGQISGSALKASLPEPSVRLGQIVEKLHTINPEALIIYIGLFNPFLDLDESGEVSLAIAEWNMLAYKHVRAYPNAIMIPTADLFELHLADRLNSDHFHPNADGYERIAQRIAHVVK